MYRYTIRALKHNNTKMTTIDQARTGDSALKNDQLALISGKYVKVDIERSQTIKSMIGTQKKPDSKE